MDPSEFCLVNHINGDSRIPLRFCVSCKKAMCGDCHAAHKDTCKQIPSSETPKDEQIDSFAPSERRSTGAPPGLTSNTGALPDTSMPPRKKLRSARGKEAKYDSDDSQNSDFTKCSFHYANEEYFCLSHCLIVCEQCVDESHGTCTVKLITDTCKDLSHTYVGEYKKWLNNLIIDCIDKQRVLTKNAAGLDIQKQSALNQLNEEYLKISDRLEVEMRKAKDDILKEHENHKEVLSTSICRIEAILARLKTSFKETNILEGRNLDVCLFQKFQQILFGNIELPSELQSLDNSLRKIKINFKGDKRYQPLSNNPKFGSVCVTTTKVNADPLPNLNFPFDLPKSYEQPRSQRRKQPKTFSKKSEVTGTPNVSKTKRTIESTSFAMDQYGEQGANIKKGNIKLNNEMIQNNCSLEKISSCSDINTRNSKENHVIDTDKSVSIIECHVSTPAETSANAVTIRQSSASMLVVNGEQETRQRTFFNNELPLSLTPNTKQENESQLKVTSVQPQGQTRDEFFFHKLQLFSQCHDYKDLELKVKEAVPEIMLKWGDISINKNINLMDRGLLQDTDATNSLGTALYKLPDELNGRVPVRVKGDGNCLSRSGSILAFGTEEHFNEIRCRIIIELIQNKKEYLSLSHINQSVDLSLKKPENLLKTYCMYSEQYKPGSKTNEANIEHVFEKEVTSICRDKTFMGIWHLFGLSSVLHSQMFSVYPYLGNGEIYHSLNRYIQPIDNRCDNVLGAIAWTTTIRDMTPINWKPNHFVPLIPISKPPQENAEVRNTFDASEVSSISNLVAAYLPGSPDTSRYCGRKRVNVSGTQLDTAATIGASASMPVLNGEHDTSQRTSLNNGNVVEDSPNVNARKTACSNLKHQVGQIGINHANSSAQRNYLKNRTENGRRENISYMPLLSKGIASNDVHTSGFTGIKVTDRGPQDSLSQPLYAYANIPCSVNDISESQAGLWNSSSHRNQNSAMTDTYVKKELELNINPISYTGNSLPIQTFQQAETLMTSSQAGVGNTSFQNCSAITVPPERNLFAMTDTHVTKDLHVLPINYSRNSLPMQNVKVPQTLMSQNINATVAMQTNRLFSDYCLTPQNQSSSFHGMSFQNMSAIKCSKYEVGVEDDQCSPYITGLSVTSDGRIIIVDNDNENVRMLSQNREKISFLNVSEIIRDVTVYNDTTAVVTGDYKLFFIDISGSKLHISKSIKTTFDPSGIQTCNKNFLVTCYDCGCYPVKLITENGEVLWSVSEDQEGQQLFSFPAYITCFQDGNQCRVVVSDLWKGTLTVLDGDSGEVIKVCKVKGKEMRSVTTDNRGNIYVCYTDTCEIAIWNKDMTNSRILTNTNDIPCALGFDASRNQLIVSYLGKDFVETFQLE